MSYIEDIKFAILRLDPASYQKLCDEFLNECGYSNIVGLGSEPGLIKQLPVRQIPIVVMMLMETTFL